MNDTTYNGWTNRETWLINLWLGVDATEAAADWARECWADNDNDADAAAYDLAQRLESIHDEGLADMGLQVGVFYDLLSGALARVNWREIAEHYIADIAADAATEEADA